MKRHHLRLLFLLALAFPHFGLAQISASQANTDTATANQHFYRGISLTKAAEYDSANFYFAKARTIYETRATQFADSLSWAAYVLCSNFIGDNLRMKGEYKNALIPLHQALAIGKQELGEGHAYVADTYNHFGNVSALQADFDTAIEYFNKSLAIHRQLHGEDHPAVARAYNNLGNAVGDKGDLDKASEYYAKALRLRHKLFGENHRQVATTYSNIATVDHVKGDYDKALEGFNQAKAIWSQTLGENHPQVALCFLNIGIIHYERGEYPQALASHTKALELFKKGHGENSFDAGDSYGNLGKVHAAMGNYGEAVALFDKSLAILQQQVGENHPQVALCYNNLGDVYYRQGKYDQAIAFHQKDLSIQQKIHGAQHWDLAQAYQDMGRCHFARNDLDRALKDYQQSLLALVPGFVGTDVYLNPAIGRSIYDAKLLTSLLLKAEAFARLYTTRSHDMKDLDMSLSTYSLASDLIDKTRSSYRGEGSKLFLGKEAARIYGKAVQASLLAYAASHNAEYRYRAFTFAEKSKASVLLGALQESRARQFAGMPALLLEREKDLRVGLAFYDTEIEKEKLKIKGRDEARLQEFEKRYWGHKREYDKLVARMETSYPRYFDLKYRTQVAAVADLQKALDEQTAVLEYFVSDSMIFAFAVTKTGFDVVSINRDSALNAAVSELAGSFKSVSGKAAYVLIAAQFHGLLIKPFASQISNCPRWVIIPDGDLYQIPFEALLTASVGSASHVEHGALPYLIKQREISYHFSATLYLKNRREAGQKTNASSFAGFAPVFSATLGNGHLPDHTFRDFSGTPPDSLEHLITRDGKNLLELPYSETELQNIFDALSHRGRVFLHEEASEDNFKRSVKGYRYVHVATHGVIVNDNPKLSNLAFSQPKERNAAEDGILYAGEIYNLDLKADLLVLSACQTGAGKVVKGEGLMALTRGFLYSGARNIVASLWKVYDEHTSRLMVEFYREVAAGKSYSPALREAKLKMIANPETAAPQSWAGFVLLGR
ncbi:MAG: CHAT domain-containing protein [bacterium]